MKLTIKERKTDLKSGNKNLRREGNIPAVLYSAGKECENIVVDGREFGALKRGIKSGQLPTTQFSLHFGGKQRAAILKDIQYHPTTYQVVHLDFEELLPNVKVRVKVPIICTGVLDCVGIKLGGFLRQVIRFVEVECLPKDIPTEFVIDVKDLALMQSKRLSDLDMPKTVRPLAKLEEVAVVIAKR
jgi:large subunit ribosomal protein L25